MIATYWASSVDAGSCNGCGERSMGLKVIVVRVETESGIFEIRFCRECADELVKTVKRQLR